MDEVNLLPEKQKPKRYWQVGPVSAAVTFFLCVAVVIGFEIALSTHRAKKRERQLSFSLDAKRAAINRTEKRILDVKQSLETLKQTIPSHPPWTDILIGLTKDLPEDLWLTSLSCHANQGSCSLVGMSTNPGAVFELLASLRRLPQFDFVDISSINKEVKQEREAVKYEITCKFAEPAA